MSEKEKPVTRRTKTNLTPVAKEIKKRMIDLDMEDWELAEAIGTTPGYITHFMRGRKSGTKYMAKISEVLSIDLNKLMEIKKAAN